MKLLVGHRYRNIEFVGFGNIYGEGRWRCPFCGNEFIMDIAHMRYNANIMSCGCKNADEAKREYLDRIELAISTSSTGFISEICQRAGISYGMYKSFMEDPKFKELVDEMNEKKRDFIESKFLEKIEEGNMTAISLAMKSRFMKSRGYAPVVAEEASQIMLDLGAKLQEDIPSVSRDL